MLQNITKFFSLFVVVLMVGIFSFSLTKSTNAGLWDTIYGENSNEGLREIGDTVFGDETPSNTVPEIVSRIIKYLLTFLGVIFVVLIIYSGFNYMIAAGDSDKINTAKDTIISASIGLAIILASYAITYFIIESFVNAVE